MRRAGGFLLVGAALLACSCGGAQQRAAPKPRVAPTPPPPWVRGIDVREGELCGIGVAGAAYDERSPYPRRLAEERAVRNLAGVLETNIQEAIIDRSTANKTTVDFARAMHVDPTLIEQVARMVKTDFWYDAAGDGPFAQEGFTYCRSCIDAKVAAERFELDRKAIQGRSQREPPVGPTHVPVWLTRTGKQPGGRLCAVGFSLPTFHPDKTFEVVVEDIRAQLADVLQTLVSSYYEELTTDRYQLYEAMTVATTEAVSKGAIVTNFWYDRDGIGPQGRKRSTYGWGCVYPVDVMLQSVSQVEKALPEQTVANVRDRAEQAFDELDAEVVERAVRSGTRPAPAPEAREQPAPEPAPEDGIEAVLPEPSTGGSEQADSTAAPAPVTGGPEHAAETAPAAGTSAPEQAGSGASTPSAGKPGQAHDAPAPGAGDPEQTGSDASELSPEAPAQPGSAAAPHAGAPDHAAGSTSSAPRTSGHGAGR